MFKGLISALLLLGTLHALGQVQTVSPYSRFGLGDLAETDFQHLQILGGIRGAFNDKYQTNLANPASLTSLTATSFEVGAFAKFSTLEEGDRSAYIRSGNFSHISLSFPVFNPIADLLNRKERKVKWAMNLSIVPYTRVGYDTETVDSTNADIGTLTYRFEGTGGSYKAQWGHGFAYKDLSVGAKLYYLFGKNTLDRSVDFEDNLNSNDNRFTNEYTYNGFGVDLGLIYKFKLNEKKLEANDGKGDLQTLHLGFYYSPSIGLNTNSDQFYRTVNTSTPGGAVDTLIFTEEPKAGSAVNPGRWGAGVYFTSGDKWRAGLSYESQLWSNYENEATEEDPGVLSDSYSFHAGVGYRPDFNSYDNFMKRLTYKFGLQFGTDPRTINGEQIKTFAVNTGVTAPFFFQRQISFVDLGLQYGSRTVTNGIKENYFKILLGFTLNDNDWFIQRKFN